MNKLTKRAGTFLLASTVLLTVGCSKDDDSPTPVPVVSTPTPSLDVPDTYTFTNSNGESTVSFSGQTIRLDMMAEMTTYMKTANTAGTQVDATILKNMYANSGFTWDNAYLNDDESKQLKKKSVLETRSDFEGFMDMLAEISTTPAEVEGTYGTAGVWGGDYLMNENGVEYTQLIEKGLMGAVFFNQMTENYLSNISNDDNDSLVKKFDDLGNITEIKKYTEMQHHWDEAFGYFTSEITYPAIDSKRFWGKYAFKRNALLNSDTKIVEAFKKGRAAINIKDYVERDAQKDIINMEMEKMCAATAMSYLSQAKTATSVSKKNHVLSEAAAFIISLKYSSKVTNLTDDVINDAYSYLTETPGVSNTAKSFPTPNFREITDGDIDNAIRIIAEATGLTMYIGNTNL
jgi:hypothetical protein